MSTLVTRNQFNITPQGIVHMPTDAAFIPHPGNPHSGVSAWVNLVTSLPTQSLQGSEDDA